MSKKERKVESGERFRWFLMEILVVFAAIILIVTVFLDFVILGRSRSAMQQTASDLIAANSRQLELNINSYLERVETVSTLFFSDESYYLYDSTDPGIDDYDKVKNEETIRNRIVDIGIMENYSDFGIIYSDDHHVGWISHGTEDLFPEGGIYEAFSKCIVNEKKYDGWCFGINGNTDRMYYVKRLNPNAILVSSTYTRELLSVFIYPEQLEGMTVRLVDENDGIIFSSDLGEEVGKKLPSEIAGQLKTDKGTSTSVITRDYIINSNLCSNAWRVICSVPKKIILDENIKLRLFTLRASGIMAILFALLGLVMIRRLSRPMDGMVTSLQEKAEVDRLSGVMNKATFEEEVAERLLDDKKDRVLAFVMLDMDNFKQINDKLGHAYGDQVIIRVGELLRNMFEDDTRIGRLGGDEFALFTEYTDMKKEVVYKSVKEQMNMVLKAFAGEFHEEREQCDVSLSAGVFLTDESKPDFNELYQKADKALYNSKNTGKSRFTFYDEL